MIEVATPRGVRARFTTRVGGVSVGPYGGLNLGAATGDDPAAVRENRRRACAAIGADPDRASLVHQVHGTRVRRADAPLRPGRFTGGLTGWPEGDGLVTDRPGIALFVLGADCLPVLMWRRDRPLVAAVHAGWRGLVGGALAAGLEALGDPAQTSVAVGPGVGACCYPVDASLRRRFEDRFGAATVQGTAVHLAGAALVELERCGVPPDCVQVLDACTACEEAHFYSYRRDGAATGRHGAAIMLEPS